MDELKRRVQSEAQNEIQSETLRYYNENAAKFCEGTLQADMSHLYGQFLCCIPAGGKILDLGCGSGRDSKYFLEHGYEVTAIDGSGELCKLASEYIGQPVYCMDFEELDEEAAYDGIWACASLLHAPKNRIPALLQKIHRALVFGGVLYVSFKRGDGERISGGRFFSDCTEEELEGLLTKADSKWEIIRLFTTGDVREGRSGEQWVNGIARKR